MLRCIKCKYDLTSLVRDAALVKCPECGGLTPHRNGEPVRSFRVSRRYWVCVLGPAACCALMVVALHVLGRSIGTRRLEGALFFVLLWGWLPAFASTVIMLSGRMSYPCETAHDYRCRSLYWLLALLLSPVATLVACWIVMIVILMVDGGRYTI